MPYFTIIKFERRELLRFIYFSTAQKSGNISHILKAFFVRHSSEYETSDSDRKDSVPTTQKSCVVHEFSCRCEARHVGRTTQKLADRIKQHVPTSIKKKSNTVREQPPRLCKNNNSKINCESAIGQHLLTNPECAKTYTDDHFRIIGQARSSFHLSVLESVYIKTQNPVLCKQKDFIFSLGIRHVYVV